MQLNTSPTLNAMWQAVATLLNSGSIDLLNSGGSVLAAIPLSSSSGTVASGVLSLAGFPKSTTATAAGSVAAARIRTSSGQVVGTLKVGATGETDDPQDPFDLIVSTRTIEEVGQTVRVTNTPTLTFVAA